MSYEHRLVEAANGREFYDKIGRDADAQIAALTEKLRAVEAERDGVQRNLELYHEVVGLIERDLGIEPMSTTKTVGGELSALRAELERKDAALKEVLVGDSNISAWGRRIIDAALLAQLEGTMYGAVDTAYFVQQASAFDLPALLAHLERTQAVVDAARKLDLDREDNNDGRAVGHWDASAEDALNAALEKESNAKR